MIGREFGVPLLVGLLAATAVWFVPSAPEVVEPPSILEGTEGIQFLWTQGPQMDGARGQILVLADPARPENVTWQDPTRVHDELTGMDVFAPASQTSISWHNEHIGTIEIQHRLLILCVRAPCLSPLAPWIAQAPTSAERFDPQNHTVGLSLYAFNVQGELVASNAAARDLDHFKLYGDYIPLSHANWYLGNGTPPADALTLPFGTDLAAEALAGLPVGAVATVHLENHPYEWLVGELWLSGRIDTIS